MTTATTTAALNLADEAIDLLSDLYEARAEMRYTAHEALRVAPNDVDGWAAAVEAFGFAERWEAEAADNLEDFLS